MANPRRSRLKIQLAIAKYEVPQNLYDAVMGANPSKWKGARNSVEMMTLERGARSSRKLTRPACERSSSRTADEIRLPTEVEWEYCCRAGLRLPTASATRRKGRAMRETKASLLDEYGWHTGNAAGNDPPVGALKPNPWGLYDMHGYLWEFCSDAWSDGVDAARPTTKPPPDRIAIRGGSWKDL